MNREQNTLMNTVAGLLAWLILVTITVLAFGALVYAFKWVLRLLA